MARTKGSKNRPKDGNGAGPKHNGGDKLTDDERRALTLHHKRLYEAADAGVEAAKDERKRVANQAKADLGKGALGEIKDMMALADHDKAKSALERHMRLARWMGLPIGFQVDMFADRQPVEEKWAAMGKAAGMAGETCAPPSTLPPSGHQVWIEHWHVGQGILMSAFGKKKADAPSHAQPTDVEERPFAP